MAKRLTGDTVADVRVGEATEPRRATARLCNSRGRASFEARLRSHLRMTGRESARGKPYAGATGAAFSRSYARDAAISPHIRPISRNVCRQWSVSMMKLSVATPK